MERNSATSDTKVLKEIRKNIETAVVSRNYLPKRQLRVSHVDPTNARFRIEVLEGNMEVVARNIREAIEQKFVYMPKYEFKSDGPFIRMDFENEFRRLTKRKKSA